MPEHVHLLLKPLEEDYSISRILAAIKFPVARKARAFLEKQQDQSLLPKLMTNHGERRVFHFWQQGGGFDKNITREESLTDLLDYIHANPVRRSLCERAEDWRWSSAGFYQTGETNPVRVTRPEG